MFSDEIFELMDIEEDIEEQYPGSAIDAPMKSVRYCPMHGVARMASCFLEPLLNTLGLGRANLRSEFKEMIRDTLGLRDDVDLTNLTPKQAKKLLRNTKILQRLAKLFDGEGNVTFRVPDRLYGGVSLGSMSKGACVFLFLTSLAQFLHFAYTPLPDEEDVKNLDVARQVIVAVATENSFPVWPAAHYMLNHALEFFLRDLTWYFFLQEAVENANKLFKALHKLSRKGTDGITEADVMKKILALNELALTEFFTRAYQKKEKSVHIGTWRVYKHALLTHWAKKAIMKLRERR